MNDWIYLGAVLFGAVSLLIEADRNYRTTLDNTPFPYHAILEQVELENLCTPREWMSGFLFYSLLYLLAYAIILSSAELFLLVRNANLAELEVGAHTEFVGPLSDPLELAGTTYGKPIFVSAFLIAFLSMGAMKPVETYIRALAHRLAGVPRGVYKVLERLQTVDYIKLNDKFPSPLLQKFKATVVAENFADVSDQYTEDILTQLSTIDCLSPSVTAGFSRLHFPLTHFDAFEDVPHQLAREIDEVEEQITKLKPNEASLKALHEKAVLASNSAKAVFAVFYVRNNHAIKNTDRHSPIAKIEKLIARGYQTELNSFAMSMFLGVLISMSVVFVTYNWRNTYTVTERPSLAETQIENAWNKSAPERELILHSKTEASITFGTDIIGTLELLAGDNVLKEGLGEDAKIVPLEQNKKAKVSFPSDHKGTVMLPKNSKVTIHELPSLNAEPLLELPVSEDKSRLTLPVKTVAVIKLGQDLEVQTDVPEKAKARFVFSEGVDATYEGEKLDATQVKLEAGNEIFVTFLQEVPALIEAKDQPSGTMMQLPTWSNCMPQLIADAEAKLRNGYVSPENDSAKSAKDQTGAKGGANEGPETKENAVSQKCERAGDRGKNIWKNAQYSRVANWSFWAVFKSGLMVLATVVATIFFREVRVDQNSWKPWSFKRIPFLRLLSMSISPALIGVFALSSASVLNLIIDSGFNVTQRQVTELFQNNWVYFAWHLAPCMALSITALILMDKHDDWPVEVSLLVSAVCGVILVGLFWVIYTVNSFPSDDQVVRLDWLFADWQISRQAFRDTIITSVLPAVFIFLFAAFLELTEDGKGSNWLVVRTIGAPVRHLQELVGERMTRSLMYLAIILIIAALMLFGNASKTEAQQTVQQPAVTETAESATADSDDPKILLRIGVRKHARPFAYQSTRNSDVLTAATPGPLAASKYTGFIVKICDAVLTDLLANPIRQEVPAIENRSAYTKTFRLLRDNIKIVEVDELVSRDKEKSRFEYFGSDFDILCDPSTITNERRNGLILSAPLFLSGVSFINLRSLPSPKREGCPRVPLIGLVGNTTAANGGIRAILEADELPRYRGLLIDWLDDGSNQCPKGKADYEAVEIYATHADASKAFCNKEFHYYLGDQEIIINSARQIPGCEFDQAARTFTTDRYAIFGKIDYIDAERARWVTRFFEVLSQKVPFSPSILDTAFADTFIGTEKSRALTLFFWSVRGPN